MTRDRHATVPDRREAAERFGLRVVLLIAAVSLAGIPFGLLLHQVVTDGPFTALDEDIARDLHRNVAGNDAAVDALEVISFLGKPIFLFLVVGALGAWLLRNGATKLVVFLAVTCIGGGLVDTWVKLAVGRPRPDLDEPVATALGKSFPSGHSMSSTICYGAVYLVLAPVLGRSHRRIALSVAIALPLAIGFSRLALGVHFVSDVLGGFVLGLAWLIASVAAFETWREERGRRATAPIAEGIEPEEGRDLVERPV
jgi:undecaprenyl-diphosphatase